MRAIFAAVVMLGLLAGGVARAEPVMLAGTEQREMRSKAGRDYRLFIARPERPPPTGGYPVIYLLDGNASFALAWSVMRLQWGRPDGTGPTPPVVVAIGYPTDGVYDMARRTVDYTPAVTPPPAGPPTGGADAFLTFIEDEVKPMIAAAHPINPKRQALLGHSYGGLFTLHVLFTKPEAFQAYFPISPSIWWNGGAIKAEEQAAKPADVPVTMMVGEFEQGPRPSESLSAERIARLTQNRMVDNAREMAARLKGQGWKVTFDELPDEDHGSILPLAIAKALRHGF